MIKLKTGFNVKIKFKVIDNGYNKKQTFTGIIIKVNNVSCTVRKISNGFSVEKTFLLKSPLIEEVKVVKNRRTRKSKGYFIRNISEKKLNSIIGS